MPDTPRDSPGQLSTPAWLTTRLLEQPHAGHASSRFAAVSLPLHAQGSALNPARFPASVFATLGMGDSKERVATRYCELRKGQSNERERGRETCATVREHRAAEQSQGRTDTQKSMTAAATYPYCGPGRCRYSRKNFCQMSGRRGWSEGVTSAWWAQR